METIYDSERYALVGIAVHILNFIVSDMITISIEFNDV